MIRKLTVLLALAKYYRQRLCALAGSAAKTGVNGSWHDITFLGRNNVDGYKADQYQRYAPSATPRITRSPAAWCRLLSGTTPSPPYSSTPMPGLLRPTQRSRSMLPIR